MTSMSESGESGNWLDQRRAYWDRRATECATDAERIDSTERSQRARFATVAPLLEGGASVLDVGCGVGDLFGYLDDVRSAKPRYHGVDISPGMVARAREKYPNGRFEVANILDWRPEPRFDLVVSIGLHCTHVPDAAAVLEQDLRQQFALCRVATHACLLSDRYDGYRPEVLRWSPEAVLSIALRITPWVSLRHDYLPHDFAVTLHREQAK